MESHNDYVPVLEAHTAIQKNEQKINRTGGKHHPRNSHYLIRGHAF